MSKATNTSEAVKPWENLGVQTTNIGMLPMILDMIRATGGKVPLCMMGESGIGKTQMTQQWVEANNAACVILNLAHMSPEDIGVPMLMKGGEVFGMAKPHFMQQLEDLAKLHPFVVLFLDEWNRGETQLVNSVFTLADTRRLHHYTLPDNVFVICAMNPSDKGYIVNKAERDPAVRRRLNFVYVYATAGEWLRYARENDVHKSVITFVEADRTTLYDTGARDAGKCYSCPASWVQVSRIVHGAEESYGAPIEALLSGTAAGAPRGLNDVLRALIDGQIGNAMGRKFVTSVCDKDTLIHPLQVLEGYEKKSDVRNKVLRLTGKKGGGDEALTTSKVGNLGEITNSIACFLMEQQPELETDAGLDMLGRLTLFLSDLPMDAAGNFVTHQIEAASRDGGPTTIRYRTLLSARLQKVPAWRELVSKISAARAQFGSPS